MEAGLNPRAAKPDRHVLMPTLWGASCRARKARMNVDVAERSVTASLSPLGRVEALAFRRQFRQEAVMHRLREHSL